jgi:uncharacterized protein YkwD
VSGASSAPRSHRLAVLVLALLLSGCGYQLPGLDVAAPAAPATGAPGDAGSPGAAGTPTPVAATSPTAPAPPAPPAPAPSPSPPAPPPAPEPPPPPAVSEIEARIVELVNRDRAAQGLAALAVDEGLAVGARDWSEQMAKQGAPAGLAHDPDLRVPDGASVAGENVAYRTTDADVASRLQAQFMRSDGHRRNVLDPAYDRIGIGVVHADGLTWVTQRFAG